jgi:hypothetical protein
VKKGPLSRLEFSRIIERAREESKHLSSSDKLESAT